MKKLLLFLILFAANTSQASLEKTYTCAAALSKWSFSNIDATETYAGKGRLRFIAKEGGKPNLFIITKTNIHSLPFDPYDKSTTEVQKVTLEGGSKGSIKDIRLNLVKRPPPDIGDIKYASFRIVVPDDKNKDPFMNGKGLDLHSNINWMAKGEQDRFNKEAPQINFRYPSGAEIKATALLNEQRLRDLQDYIARGIGRANDYIKACERSRKELNRVDERERESESNACPKSEIISVLARCQGSLPETSIASAAAVQLAKIKSLVLDKPTTNGKPVSE